MIPTIQFEAQLWGANHKVTQKEEKTVVTLHVHPTEAVPLMDISLHGKRFMVVLAMIGDDCQPVQPDAEERYREAVQPVKPRLQDRLRSEQKNRLCGVAAFQDFIDCKNAPVFGAEGLIATDRYKWTSDRVKEYCDIESGKALDTPGPAQVKWDNLLSEYRQHEGTEAEQRE